MKQVFGLFALLLILLIGIAISQDYLKTHNLPLSKTPTATINNHKFNLYIAKTPKEQEIGLSKYTKLDENFGMLFLFKRAGYYSFWMRDMKFPIDIIYMRDNRIVTIYKDIKPPKTKNESLSVYKPKKPSDTVLEITAGLSQKYNFKEGELVKIEGL